MLTTPQLGRIGGSTGGFRVQHTAQLDVTVGPESLTSRSKKCGTVKEAATLTTPATIRTRRYDELTYGEKIQAKDIWDRVKLLIEGSKISVQEKESKLYDEFDTFTSVHGETIHSYYMRFSQLINDMYIIGMTMKPIQINTKFINRLQPEWSKFVTDVKLAKDFHNTNFDHLYTHLRQHKAYANEVRQMKERFPNPLALVANTYNPSSSYTNQTQYHQQQPSPIAQQYYSSLTPQQLRNISLIEQWLSLARLLLLVTHQPTTSLAPRLTQGIWKLFKMEELECKQFKEDRLRDILSEVPNHDTYLGIQITDQSVQEIQYSKQPVFNDDTDIDTSNDSSMISYDQYLEKTETTVVQDTSSVQQDALIMSVIEEMTKQVAKCNMVDKENKIINDSLSAEA
ncbi:hypothetical protein Tco_0569825 [Tanacetum coccineum]